MTRFSDIRALLTAIFILLIQSASGALSSNLPTGQKVAVAVDPSRSPRIAFVDGSGLFHSYWNGQSWVSAGITVGEIPIDIDIAVDHWGRSHVATADGSKIQYFYREGWTWISKPLTGTLVGAPFQISLALRRDGDSVIPCIAYYDKSVPCLKFAEFKNGNWTVSTVDAESGNAIGRSPSLVIDFTGHAHIAYFAGSSSFGKPPTLKYAHRFGNSWELETVFQGSGIETSWNLEHRLCEMALNASGQPSILYAMPPTGNATTSTIRHSLKSDSGWATSLLGTVVGATSVSMSGHSGFNPDLRIGGYVDPQTKEIKASFFSGNTTSFFTATTANASVSSIENFSLRQLNIDQFFIVYGSSQPQGQFFATNGIIPMGTGIGNSTEQRIRQTLGIQDPNYVLKPTDFYNLTSLDIANLGASDLSILKTAINLVSLNATNNKISDLKPLLSLPKLASLTLSSNYLDSPQATAQIQLLQSKGVSVTIGTQRHPWNVILEPQLDAALRNRLRISNSFYQPFTRSHAQNLAGQLVIQNAGLTSLRGLEYATNLNSLVISNSINSSFKNQVSSLEPLASMSVLSDLRINGNAVSDLSPILNLPKLSFLDVSSNGLDELPGSADALAIQQLQSRGVSVSWSSQRSPWNWMLEPALEAALRSYFGMSANDTFSTSQHGSLTTLGLKGWGIESLQGLEMATGLRYLYLEGNNVSDLSPLAGLTNLQMLDISNSSNYPGKENKVEDLSPLAALNQLTGLYLQGNQVSDLSPLVSLWRNPGYRWLDVSGNGLDARSGCADDLAVQQLKSRGVDVSWSSQRSPWNWALEPALEAALRSRFGMSANATFSTIQHDSLTTLDLSGWGIESLEGLEMATGLTSLNLAGNNVSDLSPLAGLTNLRWLNVSNSLSYPGKENKVEDLSPLAGLNQLTEIYLQGNQVSDLSPLLNSWRKWEYRTLDLSDNGLDERPGSVDDLAVQQLQSRGVSVSWSSQRSPWNWVLDSALEAVLRSQLGMSTNATFLTSQHGSLTQLDLSGLGIERLQGLEMATGLISLNLEGNKINDLSPLAGLTNLRWLNVSNSSSYPGKENKVEDLSPLAGISQLAELYLQGNQVSDLSPLVSLWRNPGSRSLDVSGNGLDERPGSADALAVLQLQSRGVSVSWSSQRSPWNWMLEPTLEAALRSQLGMSADATFTTSQHGSLTSLDLSGWGIESLEGLEMATGLTLLNLAGNTVSDLSPLAGLSQLAELYLQGNQVSDLNPLVSLWRNPGSRSLDVSGNGLDERAGSADESAIQQLQSRGVSVSWSSQRSPWNWVLEPALEAALRSYFGMSANDTFSTSQHGSLTVLGLKGLGLQSLDGLELATNITDLFLEGNNVSDLSPLAGLKNLRSLSVSNNFPDKENKVEDLRPLAGLNQLECLLLQGNRVTDLTPLLSLWRNPGSRSLDVSGNGLDERLGSPDALAVEQLQSRGVDVSWWDQRSPWNWMLEPALEAALRSQFGMSANATFTTSQHGNLTSLDLSGLGIESLEGLEMATGLTSLNLAGNNVRDLGPLALLTNLQMLDVSNSSSYPGKENKVEDLSPLAGLSQLAELCLQGNQVSDLSPLLSLWQKPGSRTLVLSGNGLDARLGSPDALAVEQLQSRGVDVSWWDQRSPWNWMLEPALEAALRSQLQMLANATFTTSQHGSLTQLDLSGWGIESLEGLEKATGLTSLNLAGNNVSDLSPLAGLTNLRTLNVSNSLSYSGKENKVQDLSPLVGLSQLTVLDLRGNRVSDLSQILTLWRNAGSRTLDVSGNGLDARLGSADALAVEQLQSRRVSVTWSSQRSPWNWVLEPALDTALRSYFGLSANATFTTSQHGSLTSLDLIGWGIESLEGLEMATGLTSLNLEGNNVSDLSPLAGLTNLRTLNVSNSLSYSGKENKVEDLSPLVGLSQLAELYLQGNQVSDLSPLLSLWQKPGSRTLDVSGNGLNARLGSPDALAVEQLQSRGVDVSWWDQRSPWNWMLEPALEAALRSQLKMSANATFTTSQHGNLTSLDLSGWGIESLEGLEMATGLTSLNLVGNNVSDLSPLAGLTNLRTLNVSNSLSYSGKENKVEDLSPLAGLSQLTVLDLRGNRVTDLGPLLSLWRNPSSRTLDVSGNGLDARSGSADALAVQQLQSRGVDVSWWDQRSPWNWMLQPALEAALRSQLGMSANATFTMSQHGSLTSLDLSGWGIESLEGLEMATGLTSLNLAGNNVSDLSPLAGLTNLRTLNVSNSSSYPGKENKVEHLISLAGLSQLTELYLRGNRVTDLSPLLSLWRNPSSRTLDVSGNGLDARSGSADALAVEQLQSRRVSVTWSSQRSPWNWVLDPALEAALRSRLGMSANATFTTSQHGSLTSLDLSGWGIESLEGLEMATGLTSLNLAGNNVSDLSPLAGLKNLRSLNISNSSSYPGKENKVEDLSPLAELSQLITLLLNGNHVMDLTPLLSLWKDSTYRYLDLSGNGLDERPGSVDDLAVQELQSRGTVKWSSQRSPWNWVLEPALESALRSYFGMSANAMFSTSQHGSLTSLDLRAWGIKSLNGLQMAAGLTSLDLQGNNVSDLGPLAGLSNLRTLNVSNSSSYPGKENKVEDLISLAGLSQLTELYLRGNRVTDLGPLLSLWRNSGSRILDVSENGLDESYGSTDSAAVEQLQIRGVGVTWSSQRSPWNWMLEPALEAVLRSRLGMSATATFSTSQHGSLTTLDLSGWGIESLAGLEMAKDLTLLNLEGNNVSDLKPLAGLTNLRTLSLSNYSSSYGGGYANSGRENKVEDLSPLVGLTQIENINLRGNRVTDLSPLVNFWQNSSGCYLDVSENGLDERLGSPDALAVQQLYSQGVSVSWWGQRSPWNWMLESALEAALRSRLGMSANATFSTSQHGNLTSLDLSGWGIESLVGLEMASGLTSLNLEGNNVSDLSPLAGLTNLRTLSLSNYSSFSGSGYANTGRENKVEDLSPLVGLTQIENINLRGNRVTDLSPLVNFWQNSSGCYLDVSENGLDERLGSPDTLAVQQLQSRGVSVSWWGQRILTPLEILSQTIGSFTPIGQKFYGDAPFSVIEPSATSGLTVTLSVKSGPATISGNMVTLTGGGTVVLAANQSGNANYHAASEVTMSFFVQGREGYDQWAERHYGAEVGQHGDRSRDDDGDGISNYLEYKADTDPRDARSKFAIEAVDKKAEGFEVRWQGRQGIKYRLLWSNNLVDWSEVNESRRTGSGLTESVLDTGAEGGKRFYRVEVVD